MAPINGLYGIESAEDGSISVWNSGELFGAIDVALFILVIGGFLGVTMKTGAIQAGIGADRDQIEGPRAPDDPDPHDRVRDRRHDLRHGRGKPRVLRADHHRDDRGRLRLARCRVDPPSRLRHRRPGLDDQPVRDRHRLGVRRRVDRGGDRRPARDPRRRDGDRHHLRHAVRGEGAGESGVIPRLRDQSGKRGAVPDRRGRGGRRGRDDRRRKRSCSPSSCSRSRR